MLRHNAAGVGMYRFTCWDGYSLDGASVLTFQGD